MQLDTFDMDVHLLNTEVHLHCELKAQALWCLHGILFILKIDQQDCICFAWSLEAAPFLAPISWMEYFLSFAFKSLLFICDSILWLVNGFFAVLSTHFVSVHKGLGECTWRLWVLDLGCFVCDGFTHMVGFCFWLYFGQSNFVWWKIKQKAGI
jgi:hypothetical protein